MNVLLDPNVAYFLLIGGLVLGIIAIITPGTGFIELGALFTIVLAIYAISNLSVNSWALTIMMLGFIPLFFSGKKNLRKYMIPISGLLVLAGSMFIFRNEEGQTLPNLVLIAVIALIALSILWLFTIKGTEVFKRSPSFNLNTLLGQETLAITDIHEEGTIHINGEDWTAHSASLIPAGAMVRIIDRKGLILIVQPVDSPEDSAARLS